MFAPAGQLPPEWSALANLRIASLEKNSLAGELPPEWSNLVNMTLLDLSDNLLSGPVPPGWPSGMASVGNVDLSNNAAM